MLQEINVTSDSVANPPHARGDANPALTAALAVTVIAAATLAGAWFFQLVLDIRPCPLCLEQRYAYYLAVPLGALIAVAAARDAPRAVLYAGLAILAAAALGNLGSAGNLLERLDTVKVIRCDEVQWRFLGLSLAGYNFLISLLMAAIAAWGIARSARN